MHLPAIIRQVRQQYLNDKSAESFYEINDGLCDDFARDVMDLMGGHSETIFDVCNQNFMIGFDGDECDDDVWDWRLLKKRWGITPPEGLSGTDVDDIGFGGHVWITDGRLHYDAECPDGVANFFDLPLFRRHIVYELRERGTPADDVVTDDVVQPPVCPIPNPMAETAPSM